MVVDKMHARARWVSFTSSHHLPRHFLVLPTLFHCLITPRHFLHNSWPFEPPLADRVQPWRVNLQRVGPEKADCVWERWNVTAWLVMEQLSCYWSGWWSRRISSRSTPVKNVAWWDIMGGVLIVRVPRRWRRWRFLMRRSYCSKKWVFVWLWLH